DHRHGRDGPADVRRAGRLPADRLPRRVQPRRGRTVLRLRVDRTRLLHHRLSGEPAAPRIRDRAERPAALDPLLHPDGRHPRAMRPGGGPAGGHRPALRQDSGRPRLRRHPGRRRARRDHRHGRRLGHRHGHDLPADHDALRLRHADRHRGDRGLRHHHPGDPAEPRADRPRRPAWQVGRRHVCGRDRAVDPADPALHPLHRGRQHLRPAQGARAAGRGADPARLAADLARGEGHGALHRADFPRPRHDLPRPRHADRGGRHGRGRCDRPRLDQWPLHLVAAAPGDGEHHADHRHGDLHPDRRNGVQPGLPGRRRLALDRAHADAAARRGDRLPHRGQHLHLLPGLLPRLLRDRLHRRPAAGARRGQARHRSRLVRRADLREHADQLHAPALRLRTLLPARHRAEGSPQQRHLLGRHPVGRAAAGARRHRHLLAAERDLLDRQGHGRRPEHGADRGAAARPPRGRRAADLPV
ncbi:MAG: TRAP dicarboxylate transporter, DctM subunit, unknown substrate 6, partial [uncultured Craurococcus sp.]